MRHLFIYMMVTAALSAVMGCGSRKADAPSKEESRQAKMLLQGVWTDEETEDIVFKMQGDSVYYSDSTSLPAYFKVIDDTLYVGASARYHIEKHTEHLLWFRSQTGELVKLTKDKEREQDFVKPETQILTLTGVLKRDTVVFWNGNRYHLYIAVNPTKYKVSRHTLNEDGLDVENVYYDNIIHLSIFKGSAQIFSSDFRKKQYAKRVPSQILEQSVLNNLEYAKTDAEGFHLNASICIPGDASCYLVEHLISFDGKQKTNLLEY